MIKQIVKKILLKEQIYRACKTLQVLYRSRKGYCAVDLNAPDMGLGCKIVCLFEMLLYCDHQGLYPLIRFSYKGEKSETDYFKELFYYKNLPQSLPSRIKFTAINGPSLLFPLEHYNQQLSLSIAQPLFDKYLGFKPEIEQEVSVFTGQWFAGKKVLGVHYRGTDKVCEAPAVSMEELSDKINWLIKKEGYNLIFLSTDTEGVLEHLTASNSGGVTTICRKDALKKSANGNPVHLNPSYSKRLVHQDAIVNCLILSRCNFLLKTASFLSDFSVVFNPQLPVAVLNKPYEQATFWPASEINELALPV